MVPSVPVVRTESCMQFLRVGILHWCKELRTPNLQPQKTAYTLIPEITIVRNKWALLWIELYDHQNLCSEVLISECDYIWSYGFYRGNSVKIMSLGWALI